MPAKIRLLYATWITLSLSIACSNRPSFSEVVFQSQVSQVLVEVDYMKGMEPYVDTAQTGSEPLWHFFKNNLSALFNDTKTIVVPTTLSEMESIPAGRKDYTPEDILNLARTHRDEPENNGVTASIYIVYLDGYLISDGEVNKNIIGVSLGGSSVIAVFKPVINNQVFSPGPVKRFTEQSVLIHEAGHAIGLVNNGVPLTTSHQDVENGNHCSNPKCVMYYLNEGILDLAEFIQGGFSVEEIIFQSECLNDARTYLNAT